MQDLYYAWASPLVRRDTGRLDLAKSMRDVALENEKPERAHPKPPQDSHDALFESSFDFLNWPDPRIAEFKNFFYQEVRSVVKYTGDFNDEQLNNMRFGCHCWFHITRSGGYFPPHNHAMASWSAIFCVDPGDEEIADVNQSGRVTFFDPRHGANMYLDAANRHWTSEINFDSKRFRLKPAELVVFPSYLYHAIEPYVGERPRITIAANFWFQWNQKQ